MKLARHRKNSTICFLSYVGEKKEKEKGNDGGKEGWRGERDLRVNEGALGKRKGTWGRGAEGEGVREGRCDQRMIYSCMSVKPINLCNWYVTNYGFLKGGCRRLLCGQAQVWVKWFA